MAVNVSDAVLDTAKEIDASGVALYAQSFNEASAKQLLDAGLKIVIWTVNDVDQAHRCQELGAFGLCTDKPAEIVEALR